MSNAKFTPGPWKGILGMFGGHVVSELGQGICDVDEKDSCEEYEANIDILSAAPELYEALESLIERIEKSPQSLYPAIEYGKNALAKARGEKTDEQ